LYFINIINIINFSFGANPSWKNNRDETVSLNNYYFSIIKKYNLKFCCCLFKAFDLAVKENNTTAINFLGAHVGNEMMSTYLKKKTSTIKP
jgi:hypothetical protein